MASIDLHTGIISSPKHAPLSDAAFRLWTHGLMWSKEHLTDGFIPIGMLPSLHRHAVKYLPELLRVIVPGKGPLWHEVEGGYLIHDYEHWQETKDRIQSRRLHWREKKAGQRGESTRVSPRDTRGSLSISPSDGSGSGSGSGSGKRTSVGSQPGTIVENLVSSLQGRPYDTARALHLAAYNRLVGAGCEVVSEWEVPDRGDGRRGFVDMMVLAPERIALELDRAQPRQKSLIKLASVPDATRVVLLRDAPSHYRADVAGVSVYGLGCAPGAAVGANDALFDRFWQAYPRRTAKANALKAWRQIKPDETLLDAMLAAIRWQSSTDQWQRGIIPHPASWLNARRWEDEHPDGAINGTRLDADAALPAVDWGRV
jgi:hypothetical protein